MAQIEKVTLEELMHEIPVNRNNWQQQEQKVLREMLKWRDEFLAMHPGYRVIIERVKVAKAQKPELPHIPKNS